MLPGGGIRRNRQPAIAGLLASLAAALLDAAFARTGVAMRLIGMCG